MQMSPGPSVDETVPEPPTKRIRKKAPKTRQGCSRCKSRRIKCDEQRPSCRNCIVNGCQCPGFQQQWRWSQKYERLPTQTPVREVGGRNNHDLGYQVISGSLIYTPTELIEHWFRYVCPMMSAFDSEINYNRRLAHDSWSTSETVFLTMKAMSAACLPLCNSAAASMRVQATGAITRTISQIRRTQGPRITVDLVFAVFALGTSLRWANSDIGVFSDDAWLRVARELLSMWKSELSTLDALFYSHFHQALTYWEMLVIVAGGDLLPKHSTRHNLDHAGVHGPLPLDSGLSLLGTRPNSWCGISDEVIRLFGQVLALCWKTSVHVRGKNVAIEPLKGHSSCDLHLAHKLKEELLAMDFGVLVFNEGLRGSPIQTRDENTPISHLLQTAEAFRLAALIQLVITFDVLTANCSDLPASLAIYLTEILESIPAQSGSRSMHLVLYLSAAVGLYNNNHLHETEAVSLDSVRESSHIVQEGQLQKSRSDLWDITCHDYMPSSPARTAEPCKPVSASMVMGARNIIMRRLGRFKHTMPHKRVDSMLHLIQTVWAQYDTSEMVQTPIHWIEIMRTTGLEVIP